MVLACRALPWLTDPLITISCLLCGIRANHTAALTLSTLDLFLDSRSAKKKAIAVDWVQEVIRRRARYVSSLGGVRGSQNNYDFSSIMNELQGICNG